MGAFVKEANFSSFLKLNKLAENAWNGIKLFIIFHTANEILNYCEYI